MKKLDREKLLAALDEEIQWLEEEAQSASELGWHEKAAKHEVTKQGVERAARKIRLGDFDVDEKPN